jgi:hypothetical protein
MARYRAESRHSALMLTYDSRDAHPVRGKGGMAVRKDKTRYEYVETLGGGRLKITTVDPQSLTAVHAFLRFQIADHRNRRSADSS